MQDENKKCFRCKNFDRYYTREVKKFKKTKFGWCFVKQENVNSSDGCEKCVFRKYDRKISPFVKISLNNLLTEISEIRILKRYLMNCERALTNQQIV